VESKRLIRREAAVARSAKRCLRAISIRRELRLRSSHTLALLSALEIASASLSVIVRSNLEKSAVRQAMKPRNFFSELKRRNVYKVAIAYGVVAWLLIQVATQVFPFFEVPNWGIRLIVLFIVIGCPVALILAWAFELTPEGIKRTDEIEPERRSRNRAWIFVVIIAGAISIGLFFLGRFTAVSKQIVSNSVSTKSIAVLPFENFSEDKAFAFFADGVQDEILTDLAKIADLKVISRTSMMRYKSSADRDLRQIAQQLGVAHVLEGSVQRSANRVRVSAQLIDARNDTHVWADKYDRDLADVFAIQSEIAQKIADQLQAKISPRERLAIEKQPTKDLAAYDLYVRATEAIDAAPSTQNLKENFLEAISLLEQAIARDPAFFNAYCKLAQAHDQLYLLGEDHTRARLASAEQAINAALRLQPDAAEAHLAQAGHLYSKLDYEGARAETEVARRSLPNDARVFELSGYVDRRQGRWPESARNLERALEVDPNNVSILWQIALSYESLRDYAKDGAVLDRILALRPNDLDARLARGQLEVAWKADTRPLHEMIESSIQQHLASSTRLAPIRIFLASVERDAGAAERALADLGDDTYGPDAIQFSRAFGEGQLARWKGDAAAAHTSFTTARAAQQRIVDAQPDYGPALCVLGLIDAGLGRKEDALREGRRAVELTPPSKDSINGPIIMGFFAVTCAWVGEKDLAIEQLTRALQLPGRLSYGQLRLSPNWDPLRGDPRFEKIVASLAPKEPNR
jgi:TolB-like protein/Tfp pilus assembly protein PilF